MKAKRHSEVGIPVVTDKPEITVEDLKVFRLANSPWTCRQWRKHSQETSKKPDLQVNCEHPTPSEEEEDTDVNEDEDEDMDTPRLDREETEAWVGRRSREGEGAARADSRSRSPHAGIGGEDKEDKAPPDAARPAGGRTPP